MIICFIDEELPIKLTASHKSVFIYSLNKLESNFEELKPNTVISLVFNSFGSSGIKSLLSLMTSSADSNNHSIHDKINVSAPALISKCLVYVAFFVLIHEATDKGDK